MEEQLAQDEEAAWEQNSTIQAEIQEARAAYQAGDYMTIDEYITQRYKTIAKHTPQHGNRG